ncbi:hypothetical protein [Isoptericola cucumis]|uniref:DUF559 domain-containing protein n=1 Tax=Isoptericola cucumis TaxID=1776856 RepID=A0ABQ2B8E2_9MICO|nr:hypothetical protein [Isoptericola cucumis]GGI08656.1 hypothetical protein GCM10007368_22250 [Isoptericola cucumis]
MSAVRTFAEIPAALLALADAQEGLLSVQQCDRNGVDHSRRTHRVRAGLWRVAARGVVDTCPVLPGARSASDLPQRPVAPLVVTDDATAWARSREAWAAARRSRSPADRLFDHLRRRSAWAGMLAYGPDAIAVASCALACHGVEGLPVHIAPQAALPTGSRRRSKAGVRLRQFDDGMMTVAFGDRRTGVRRIASAERALAQAVPELPAMHGLAVLDSALRLEVVSRAGAARAHDHARGRRGVAARHELWDLADPRAESPLESFGRWQCIEAGVPPDTLQRPVRDRHGRLLGVGDMAWELNGGGWLVVEMDGYTWHEGDAGRARRDRDRDNDFAAAGIHVLRFDARHVREHTVGTRVRSFLG